MEKGEVSEPKNKMTPEQLLKPRYKVLIDYLFSPYAIGDEVEIENGKALVLNIPGHEYVDCKTLSKCIKQFKEMEWWEGLKRDELPKFVKTKETSAWHLPQHSVFKVLSYSQVNHESKNSIDNVFVELEGNFDREYRITQFLPATETEYNQYLKTKQQ